MKQATPSANHERLPLGASQSAALARLHHAADSATRFAVLCGPAGSGKTTVLGHLAAIIDAKRVRFIDDAHLLPETEIDRLAAPPAKDSPATTILSGQGRLLTLLRRSSRLAGQIGLRAVVGPLTRDESHDLALRLIGDATATPDAAVLDTIHDIAGGLPRGVERIAGLARLLVEAEPDRPLRVMDIERIQSRLLGIAA